VVRCEKGHPLKLNEKGRIDYNCERCGYVKTLEKPKSEEKEMKKEKRKIIKGGED